MPGFNFEFLQLNEETQNFFLELFWRFGLFLFGVFIAPIFGRFLPLFFCWILKFAVRFFRLDIKGFNAESIKPVKNSIINIGTLVFIALCLNILWKYQVIYQILGFFVYLALAISIAWLASRLAQRAIRLHAIDLVQRLGGEVNEVALVFETLTNVIIILFAVIIFASGLQLNLTAILTSIGIGGVAVAFGARQALERLIGTLELFLDRPYQPGEYIQVNFNPYGEDVYGRVESIGLRSTKIRTAARNTIIIVPNSIMASKHIENITRGKKVVAMFYLDFSRLLKESERALVKRVIIESTDTFWGISKGNTRIYFSNTDDNLKTRVRVNFFLTSSGEDSLKLRKRLVELADQAIAFKLSTYDLKFSMPEPMIYIDSPMTI
ncbi:mechanosensitive ion channel family protein [Mastigocoleus testarum]|uniref:Mechanosensitive ion channel protein MscS n=1 Tax=Mastigocoleus testarum BC008 TaxID=371196 RepID=A0A0V7ZZT1_9CYAN|nr:mechanosensitive ion channel domain-containing protein [Mastigocoleus testarum]KST69975.1 mechanosensitive ion channel protein MscS [Mastigocoleus testarum BC008]